MRVINLTERDINENRMRVIHYLCHQYVYNLHILINTFCYLNIGNANVCPYNTC